jgi:hypothetical protein
MTLNPVSLSVAVFVTQQCQVAFALLSKNDVPIRQDKQATRML